MSVAPKTWEKTRRRDGQAGNPYRGTFLGNKRWVWQTVEMKRSPAWKALSLSARKVLDRLEIEFSQHGNNPLENGNLPCTYDHFEEYGINRHQIGPAIRELIALGFIQITRKGSAGNAGYREASLYLLTFRHAGSDKRVEDGWKRIKTMEEAEKTARDARARVSQSRAREFGIKGAVARWKNKSPVMETIPNPPPNGAIPSDGNHTDEAHSPVMESIPPLELGGGGGRLLPPLIAYSQILDGLSDAELIWATTANPPTNALARAVRVLH